MKTMRLILADRLCGGLYAVAIAYCLLLQPFAALAGGMAGAVHAGEIEICSPTGLKTIEIAWPDKQPTPDQQEESRCWLACQLGGGLHVAPIAIPTEMTPSDAAMATFIVFRPSDLISPRSGWRLPDARAPPTASA